MCHLEAIINLVNRKFLTDESETEPRNWPACKAHTIVTGEGTKNVEKTPK